MSTDSSVVVYGIKVSKLTLKCFIFYILYTYRRKVFRLIQHFVHLNLCLALLLGLITFVSGIETASAHRV